MVLLSLPAMGGASIRRKASCLARPAVAGGGRTFSIAACAACVAWPARGADSWLFSFRRHGIRLYGPERMPTARLAGAARFAAGDTIAGVTSKLHNERQSNHTQCRDPLSPPAPARGSDCTRARLRHAAPRLRQRGAHFEVVRGNWGMAAKHAYRNRLGSDAGRGTRTQGKSGRESASSALERCQFARCRRYCYTVTWFRGLGRW